MVQGARRIPQPCRELYIPHHTSCQNLGTPPESESEYETSEARVKRSLAPCAWLGPKTQEAVSRARLTSSTVINYLI